MKAKKAAKSLARAETLLAALIERYTDGTKRIRNLLAAAKESIVHAKKLVSSADKTASKRRRLHNQIRKKLSPAAKRQWALAKRKEVQTVAKRSLSKTA